MGIATVDTARDIATVLTLSTGRQPSRGEILIIVRVLLWIDIPSRTNTIF
jgi:hypothetical protein